MENQIRKCSLAIREAHQIIILTGAGISTSAGIHDFRTPGTGLYDNLQKYNLPYPEAIFDIDFFRQNPKPFFELARELLPGNYQPTPTHRFIRRLEEEGKLVRNYTQNIDGLERAAHIERVIECHGTFRTATCLTCGKKYSLRDIEDTIRNQDVPLCSCSQKSVIKPDIVFFHEHLPTLFFHSIPLDFPQCDLLLIMGTSLNVYPVASLLEEVSPVCPVIMINKTPPAAYRREIHLLLGDCDEVCSEISKEIFGRLP
ncbi:MAG: Sir2 family NAD-dependent protein deacetylase [bacterium]